jgi:hypothetical protein
MKKRLILFFASVVALSVSVTGNEASAVPAFARKYHTACSTCHLAFPIRNGFGEAFRNNGYRFPDGTDEEMVKEEPIKLGSDAYKKQFPNAIWPSDLPNMPTLGFLARAAAYSLNDPVTNKHQSQFDQEIDMFFAGTITNQISYIGDVAFSDTVVGQQFAFGRLQVLWTFQPGITMAFGTVGFPEQFDMITLSAGGDLNGYAAQMPNPNKGVEIRLTGNMGGTFSGYSLIAGVGRNSETAGLNPAINPGGSFTDTRYARATIKFGGEGLLNGAGGKLGNDIIGLDNSVTLGFNVLNSGFGSNVNAASTALTNAVTATTGDYMYGLTHNAFGGDVRINYGNARLVGQITRFAQVIDPLTGINYGKRNAYSVEGDYWIYPWLFAAVRYEHMNDPLNGEFTKLIPGIGALLRPNFKVGLEYVDIARNTVVPNAVNTGSVVPPQGSIGLYTQLGF